MTLEEKVIDAFQVCDAVINQAEQIRLEKQAADRSVAAEIPGVVEVLVAKGLIGSEEKEAAAVALRDPAQALVLLKRAAAFAVPEKAEPTLGSQVDNNGRPASHNKQASHVMGSESSPYVGARTTGPKPSDVALMRGLGLA